MKSAYLNCYYPTHTLRLLVWIREPRYWIMNGAEIIINVVVIAVLSYGEKKIPEMTGSFDNEANTQQIKNQKWSKY